MPIGTELFIYGTQGLKEFLATKPKKFREKVKLFFIVHSNRDYCSQLIIDELARRLDQATDLA